MRRLLILFLILFSTLSIDSQEKITLLFCGDLMQHESQLNAAHRAAGGKGYDYTACFSRVQQAISEADIAIANLEVTLAGKGYSGYPLFCAPDSYLQAIKDAGFDVLLTANNHCLDRGAQGLHRTNRMLDSLRFYHLGTGSNMETPPGNCPLLIEKNGFRIALLNYTYGTNGFSTPAGTVVNRIEKPQMLTDIETAKALHPDLIIACLHWGEEFHSLPSTSQRDLAEWLFAHGVDHVIGSHPHVLQPMELHRHPVDSGAVHVVVYSLGNYLSGMYERTKDGGAMVKLTFEKRGLKPILTHCSYSLVWAARPNRDSVPNFILLPSSTPTDSLPAVTKAKFTQFLDDSRRLLRKHNIGIEEEE